MKGIIFIGPQVFILIPFFYNFIFPGITIFTGKQQVFPFQQSSTACFCLLVINLRYVFYGELTVRTVRSDPFFQVRFRILIFVEGYVRGFPFIYRSHSASISTFFSRYFCFIRAAYAGLSLYSDDKTSSFSFNF